MKAAPARSARSTNGVATLTPVDLASSNGDNVGSHAKALYSRQLRVGVRGPRRGVHTLFGV